MSEISEERTKRQIGHFVVGIKALIFRSKFDRRITRNNFAAIIGHLNGDF